MENINTEYVQSMKKFPRELANKTISRQANQKKGSNPERDGNRGEGRVRVRWGDVYQ